MVAYSPLIEVSFPTSRPDKSAVRAGAHGAVFESIDDDGDGVRIVLE